MLPDFENVTWLLKLAYLVDIVGKVIILNMSLKEREMIIVKAIEKIHVFKEKHDLCHESGNMLRCLPSTGTVCRNG